VDVDRLGIASVVSRKFFVRLDGISPLPLFVLVTASSVASDSIGYYLGRTLGGVRLGGPGGRWAWLGTVGNEVQRYFRPWSGLTVFLIRWLFTPLSSAVNLLAGISRYPFRRFLVFAAAGEAISSGLFLGVGYVFGVNSTYLWDYFDGLPGILAASALGLLLTVIGVRRLLRPSGTSTQDAG
jgi:membrane-associated protein